MEWINVMKPDGTPSSNIGQAAYDKDTQALYVRFRAKGGPASAYEYDNVPEEIFQQLLSSESPGQFFHQAIRQKFAYRRIDNGTRECQ